MSQMYDKDFLSCSYMIAKIDCDYLIIHQWGAWLNEFSTSMQLNTVHCPALKNRFWSQAEFKSGPTTYCLYDIDHII